MFTGEDAGARGEMNDAGERIDFIAGKKRLRLENDTWLLGVCTWGSGNEVFAKNVNANISVSLSWFLASRFLRPMVCIVVKQQARGWYDS